ncbi:MAG: amino acid--tRNA ligase-related protein [Leptospirales bacterium]
MESDQAPFQLKNSSAQMIRDYFASGGLKEVFTPVFVKSGALEPFLDSFSLPEFGYVLPTSPEFSLKKQLALVYGKTPGIFEIAHAFRNEPLSSLHSHEFTMVEWYRNGTEYVELRNDVENIIAKLSPDRAKIPVSKILTVEALFKKVFPAQTNFEWNSKHYKELANTIESIRFSAAKTDDKRENPVTVQQRMEEVELFSLLYDYALEKASLEFNGILFVHEFPQCVRGMAKLDTTGKALRMEAILNGIEIANGYQEMNSPKELVELWNENNDIRKSMGKDPHPVDETLVELTSSLDACGMALGLERVLMALYGIEEISSFIIP